MLFRIFDHLVAPRLRLASARAVAAREGSRVIQVLADNMAPTLHRQEMAWYAPIAAGQSLARGQVVVVSHPAYEGALVPTRVVGLPGERVEILDGDLLIDGQWMPEPYVRTDRSEEPYSRRLAPVAVPAQAYWLMGDFRDMSKDSRVLGPFPAEAIVGVITKAHPSGAHRELRVVR